MNRTLQLALHKMGLPVDHPDRTPAKRSPRWPAARKAWLKDHPMCEACGGTKKVEVHHIWPFSWPAGKLSELSEDNFISLCDQSGHCCHLMIGHSGDYKSRNPNVVDDAAAALKRIQSRPYPGQQ